MKKRFTDADKWEDAWFGDLPSKYKLFWMFILDKVDHAGIWKVNFKLAKFMIGEDLEPSEVKRFLNGRIEVLSDDTWFVPKFLKFQYPKGLNTNNKPQKSVIEILKNHNCIDTVCKLYGNSYITVQDKDKDKDKDKDIDRDKEKDKEERETEFREKAKGFVEEYGEAMLEEFCDYWTESNEKGKLLRFEKEKTWDLSRRLKTWFRRSKRTAPTVQLKTVVEESEEYLEYNKWIEDSPYYARAKLKPETFEKFLAGEYCPSYVGKERSEVFKNFKSKASYVVSNDEDLHHPKKNFVFALIERINFDNGMKVTA